MLRRFQRIWVAALLVLPTACGLFLEDFRIDDSKLLGAACQLGEQRCVGDWLVSCAASLDHWADVQACGLPERCDSGQGICTACRSGEYRCQGAELQVCNAARSGWDSVETCASGVACNLNLQACAACTPNEYQCNGGVLSQCSADGSWGAPTQCGASELCVVSENRASGQCVPSAMCEPGKYACQEARLVRCDAQGVSWLPIETCASAALCADSLSGSAASGLLRCAAPACAADQARCDGNQLMLCGADRKGFTAGATCSADNPCNPKLRACGRCTPGEAVCSGADLLSCEANGTFQRAQTCASAALCNAPAAACDPPECDRPGRASCDPTMPQLVQCGDDLKARVTYCDTPALCNPREGRCEQPTCAAGAVRCDEQRLEFCNADQTGWDTRLSCSPGTFCDVATQSCVSGSCAPNSYRCNDVFLERCGTSGYERVARCAAAALCHADIGMCDPPECAPGTFHCVGKSLQKCGAALRWIDFTTCAGQCDDIGGKCL